jgi:hypothetical protein
MATDVNACGHGRGGFGGGYRSYNNYSYNNAPNYQAYPQQQIPPQQYQYPQQVPQQQYPRQQMPQQQYSQQMPQQPMQQQGQPQQYAQSQPQTQPQQFSQQGMPQGQAAQQVQPAMAQNVAPQARVAAKPVSTGGMNVIAPNTAAPTAPAPQQTVAQPAQSSAEMSALQALSGWDAGEQPAPDAQATAQANLMPTGNFVATLPTGATVQLRLMEDSSFSWIATNKGKSSSFQGSFTIEGGSLKLLRSNDNQKLEGAFGQTQTGFTFKLSGQGDNSLNFIRS